jgi:hypothetical protein
MAKFSGLSGPETTTEKNHITAQWETEGFIKTQVNLTFREQGEDVP